MFIRDATEACKLLEEKGGDDVDDSDANIVLESSPSNVEVQKTLSTINRYTEGVGTPLARKLEVPADALSRQIRLEETKSMKEGWFAP